MPTEPLRWVGGPREGRELYPYQTSLPRTAGRGSQPHKEAFERMNIVRTTRRKLDVAWLRLCNRVAQDPLLWRYRMLRQRRFATALGRETGQGLLEYIIAIAGVFVVAAAVLALYRAIQAKYGEATGSVNSLGISAP